MPAQVEFHSTVEKRLKRLPKNIQERFWVVVERLKENPLAGIPLKGDFKGERKYRIGDYRILYRYFSKDKTVFIYQIESRQGVYKN